MSPHRRAALVVTFDQLPASILGCYGNEWVETPNLDRLAASGFLSDQCWSAGVGPATAETAFAAATGLQRLSRHSVATALFREDAVEIDFAAVPFDAVQIVAGERGATARPDSIPLANLVHAARSEWTSSSSDASRLVWLHARGLEIPAEPPPGFAELYQDEFADRGVDWDALTDAERQRHPLMAAGLVSLLDHWLGELFAAIEAVSQPLLIAVTAAHGAAWQPLPNSFGESDALRSQAVHVPFLATVPGESIAGFSASQRDSRLLSPQCLESLLGWWFSDSHSWSDWQSAASALSAEPRVTTSTTGRMRITSAAWSAVLPTGAGEAGKPLLFRKPEDYWEVNNLADVLPDVVEELQRSAGVTEERQGGEDTGQNTGEQSGQRRPSEA